MNTSKLSIRDFSFSKSGYGHYYVTYTSPRTGKSWTSLISDMSLIDSTLNSDCPMVKDLITLKRVCKS